MPTNSPSTSSVPSVSPTDSLSPSLSTSPSESQSPTKCFGDEEVIINVLTDSFPLESYWTLSDNCGKVVAHSEKYEKSFHTYSTFLCLPSDKYKFIMYDSFGDGSYGYKLIVNGKTEIDIGLWWGGEIESSVGEATTCPLFN